MPPAKQSSTELAPAPAAEVDTASSSSRGDQSAAGAAAVSRMASELTTTPDFQTALAAELGAFAAELSVLNPSSFVPVADQIIASVAANAGSSSSSSADSSSSAPTSTATAPAAKTGGPKKSDAAKRPATLVEDLEKEILGHLSAIEAILPADVRAKIDAYTKGHPEVIYGALIAAALADYFSGIKPAALTHKFDLGDGFKVTPKVQTGTLHEKLIQSIGATLEYTKANFTASAGANWDFQGGSEQYTFGLTEKEIDILGQHLEASFNYTLTDGTKPSQKIIEAVKLANFQLQNTTTWAPGKGKKGKPGPTQMSDTLTESFTSNKLGGGWQASGSVTENFGKDHKADSAKVGLTLPAIHGVVVSFSDQQSFGPGSGSGVNTQGVNFKINERLSVDVQHGAALSGEDLGGAVGGSANHTWSVGLKFKL